MIQNFIGALQMRGASKGVLITTSGFSSQAETAAKMIPSMRIVLIDGDRLAGLMIRYNVGVRTERTVEIKKLDFDYFEPDVVWPRVTGLSCRAIVISPPRTARSSRLDSFALE